MLKSIAVTVCLGLLASACAAEGTDSPAQASGLKPVEDATIKAEPLPEVPGSGDTGPVPKELLDAVSRDLAEQLGVAAQSIKVVSARSVVFNDGSLGCPKPGEQYTQALVDGYHILLTDGSRKFDYRADQNRRFFHCKQQRAKGTITDPRE